MNKISINKEGTSVAYIGTLDKEEFKKAVINYKKVAIIWDEKINSKYVSDLGEVIEGLGNDCIALSVNGGEQCKTLETYERVIKYLLDFNLSRYDLIIGVGGGTTLDLAGFISATYLRGVDFISIPTTLLSMVDSSIGGKNGINFNSIKNIIGTIKHPKAVFVHLGFLDTLSDIEYRQGIAEIIKIAILMDKDLFNEIKENPLINRDKANLEKVITRAIELKAKIVKEDEKDLGLRHVLNFGHTYGHAIESGSNFKIGHGDSVSIGILMEIKKLGLDKENIDLIESVLKANKLMTKSPIDQKTIFKNIKYDKKKNGDLITISVVKNIGEFELKEINIDELK